MSKKKPLKRPHLLKKDYLFAIAVRLHSQNPPRVIVFNTLVDIYSTAYTDGYFRAIDEFRYRREKREKHIKDDFDKVKDIIDDEIHSNTK